MNMPTFTPSTKCLVELRHSETVSEYLGEAVAMPRRDGTVQDVICLALLITSPFWPSKPGELVEQFSEQETVLRYALRAAQHRETSINNSANTVSQNIIEQVSI